MSYFLGSTYHKLITRTIKHNFSYLIVWSINRGGGGGIKIRDIFFGFSIWLISLLWYYLFAYIFCSVAILKYLAKKYKAPSHWYPENDALTTARIDEYMNWQHQNLRQNFFLTYNIICTRFHAQFSSNFFFPHFFFLIYNRHLYMRRKFRAVDISKIY